MMRKITYILFLTVIAFACDRDDIIEGTGVSFYPTVVASGAEQDENTYVLNIATSQFVSGTASITLELDMSAAGAIETTPPLDGNRITVDISGNNTAQVFVTIGNDAIPDDYTAIFRIVDASNGLQPSRTNKFTLFVQDTDTAPLFEDDFESGLGQWTLHNEGGSNTWGTTTFNGNSTALVSAFGSSAPADEDNWMVSPEINFDTFGGERLKFISIGRFNTEDNKLEVSVLSNYDGSDPYAADQTILDVELDPFSGSGFGNATPSGNIDLSQITGIGHIAFHYTTESATDASGWEVDDVIVSIFNPSASNGGDSEVLELPFDVDFEDCTTDFSVPAGFTEEFASGAKTDRGWGCRQEGVDDGRAVRVNAFGGDAGFEDAWLISEARYDLRSVAGATLAFDVKSEGNGDGQLRAYYTDTYYGGDPTAFSWTEIDITSQLPAKGSGTYTSVSAPLNGAGGKRVFVAFRFDGATESNSASYDIDNVLVEPIEAGTIPLPFSDDFENCSDVGDFNIPANWIEENVPGSKTDRGWGCRPFGRSGNGIQASAFGGDAGNDNAWLISNGKFDLTTATSTSLEFYVESFFNGAGGITLYWSDDYVGSGDPTAATWTEVTDATSQFPTAGSGGFTQISTNVDDAVGKKIFIAIQYESVSDNASSWTIDDMTFTAN